MNFDNFITSYTGFIHFISSITAIEFGTLILILRKGSAKHKLIGRLYCISMLIVLITAFMIYRLFGTWGMFHWAAVLGSITLLLGMLPILFKRPINNYITVDFCFMYWSVMGLYGAFVSEIFVRMPNIVINSGIPKQVFYYMTGIGTALVMAIGVYFFLKLKPKWDQQFGEKPTKEKEELFY